MARYYKNPTSIRKQKKECKKLFFDKKTRVSTLDVFECREWLKKINRLLNNKEFREKIKRAML